jgi:hypothetical protein
VIVLMPVSETDARTISDFPHPAGPTNQQTLVGRFVSHSRMCLAGCDPLSLLGLMIEFFRLSTDYQHIFDVNVVI